MPTIALPAVPDVQRAQAPVANRNAAAEVAPYRGSLEIAGAVGQVGDVMQNFAVRSARAKQEADFARGRIEMEKTFAEIQADLEANPNPREWDKLTAARMEKASGTIFASQDLAPETKRRLELEFKAWAQSTTLNVRNQAQRQQNTENDGALAQAQGMAIANGDLAEAERYIEVRRSLGLISDTRAQVELARTRVDVDKQLVARAINDDPMAAVDLLEDQTDGGRYRNFRNLSEADRIMALRSAKNARETARAENAQALSEEIYAGGLRSIGVTERIDDAVTAGRILPSQGNTLKRLATGEYNPQQAAASGATLWRAAMALDRAAPDYIEQSAKIRAELHTLPPEIKAPVLEALKGVDANSVTEVTRDAFALLQRDYQANVDVLTKQDVERMPKAEAKAYREKYGKKPEAGDFRFPDQAEEASAALFRKQDALRRFIDAHPTATAEEILKERARLSRGDARQRLGQIAVDAVTGAAIQ